jgi:hypothetical protein
MMVVDVEDDRPFPPSGFDGNPYVGWGHRWWFVLASHHSKDERDGALEWLTGKLLDDLAWVVFPTAGFRL